MINKDNTEKKRSLSILKSVKKYSVVFIILIIFAFLFVCDKLGPTLGITIMDDLKSVATSFIPTTDLFDDGSEVSFVSYFFGIQHVSKDEKASFSYPTASENISTSGDFLCYKYTGVVNAVCSGVVCAVGFTQNGEKYIEIEHPEGYVSRYIGLDYVGAMSGQKVGKGSTIALSSEKQPYKVYVHQNGNLIKVDSLVWEE